MSEITIYTTDACRHCRNVKAFLESRGLSYAEVNLSRDPDGRMELAQRTGLMTFPQVVVGDAPVGGFEALLRADRDGTLDELLAA